MLLDKMNKAIDWQKNLKKPEELFYQDKKNRPDRLTLGKHWLQMSCLQQNILKDLDVPSMYVIQPLPFLEGNKQMTTNEKKMLQESDFGDRASEFSAVMKELFQYMDAINLNYVDYSSIFKDISEAVSYTHLTLPTKA